MDRKNKKKWIRTAALTLTTLTLCACSAQDELPAESVAATAAPAAATTAPTATPLSTPIQTTQPETTATVAPTPTPAATYAGKAMCMADEYVNIRAGAGTDAEVLGKLPAGKTANVLACNGKWVNIVYNGIKGYVSRDYIIGLHWPGIAVPSGEWAHILVNKRSLLPDGFTVSLANFEGGQVDARILDICKRMFADAKEDGVTFQLVDAYRSFETQSAEFEKKVQSYIDKGYSRGDAEAEASTITARPNTSEHQTGLALDIVTPSHTDRNSGFAQTRAFAWLDANAANYGLTMRYPDGKEDITGVIYEPWHWRFVGVDAASAMKQSGECLEEYFRN